jgi:hypothetical protein
MHSCMRIYTYIHGTHTHKETHKDTREKNTCACIRKREKYVFLCAYFWKTSFSVHACINIFCIHIYIHSTYTHRYTYLSPCLEKHVVLCMHAIHIWHMRAHIHTHTCMHEYKQRHRHTQTYTWVHTYIHTYMQSTYGSLGMTGLGLGAASVCMCI